MNLLATMLLLAGIAVLYGLTGTLNLAHLAVSLRTVQAPGLLAAVAMVFFIAIGIKAAVFPLFFWLPAAYHTLAVSVTAVFSGLLSKMGVYALLRLFTLLFDQEGVHPQGVLVVVAGLTMLTGVLSAAAHDELRRILSFHIISQIGYMIMGLALLTRAGLAEAIFFLPHNIMAKANLFLVSGAVRRLTGSFELKEIGGLYATRPLLSGIFFISAFALAGYPPFSGFWAKLVLVKASFAAGQYTLGATALLVGLLTAYSMTKIWNEAFWKPPTAARAPVATKTASLGLMLPAMALLVGSTLLMSFAAEPILRFADQAAGELLHKEHYVAAILGEQR